MIPDKIPEVRLLFQDVLGHINLFEICFGQGPLLLLVLDLVDDI